MSSFLFLFLVMVVGIVFWNIEKYPKLAKAGFVMFVIGLAAICYGAHPYVPAILTR